MPNMDGKEAFFELRKIDPHVKILVSTGFTVDQEVESLVRSGCHGFLQKPFSMDRFSVTVRQVIDGDKGGGRE